LAAEPAWLRDFAKTDGARRKEERKRRRAVRRDKARQEAQQWRTKVMTTLVRPWAL
jgi:hypothetical protein